MTRRPIVVARAEPGDGWGTPPYDAAVAYPERPGTTLGDNGVYGPARAALAALGLDRDRAGTPGWNPLADLVPAGGRVVLKPNLVRHRHGNGGTLDAVVTDPRLLRAVLDYAVAAVGAGGEVIIADSPLQSCEMSRLSAAMALPALIEAAAAGGARVRLLDYRREEVVKGVDGLIARRKPLSGDPEGYVPVDLGEESELCRLFSGRDDFRVTQYDPDVTQRHHDERRHEFLIPRSLLSADLVISMPKIKTHRKAGMTGALKNLVGINGSKAWLPHHRVGSTQEGGDEYQHRSLRKRWMTRLWERMDRTPSAAERRLLGRLDRLIRRSAAMVPFPDPFFEGSWWGNRTMPAMVCDLNRIFMYADADGRLQADPVRRFLVVADAVVAGEGEGPLEPCPRPLGRIIAGDNAVAVDWVVATLMGFSPLRIPTLKLACARRDRPLIDLAPDSLPIVEVDGGARSVSLRELAERVTRAFTPAAGWTDHIEAERVAP